MREILFRGKRKDNGEWVYGDLMHKHYNFNTEATKVIHNNIMKYKVIPETVGQYTGLTDKNGNKIFEGDIIDTPDRLIEVVWLNANSQFDLNFVKFAHDKRIINFRGIEMRNLHSYEIIGNIHDNPELLKG